MSQMSDIHLEITERLEMGMHPVKIAKALKVPLTWVYDLNETREPDFEDEEVFDPHNTINS